MFRHAFHRALNRTAEIIDDMLLGDFDYIEDETGLYADIDYYRLHPHRGEFTIALPRRGCNAPAPRGVPGPCTSAGHARHARV